MTSCWTDIPSPQLYGRVPQPVTNPGSKVRENTGSPRFLLSMAPHSRFFSVLLRSQFGTKSLFRSVHNRVVLTVVRVSGFMSRSLLVAVTACMYFPRLNLTAVLPFPKTSYATPMRGVTSLQSYPAVDPAG